ncbi:MAG: protein kinase domain-containing protein [Gemmatimonadaceae bacterium]
MSSPLEAKLQDAIGGSYAVQRELGGGGMSRVFVAEERSLGRQVVIKVLPPELSPEMSAERFRREIQLAARLQHPHLVPLHSAGEAKGLLFYTMPYVDGETLRARLAREGAIPAADAERVLRDVLDALDYAHGQGVVHRDIKPENILLSGRHALVADFGVAKALVAATEAGQGTTVGIALGTPTYMSPEQAAADSTTDYRADIYSVGVVAYEMLTGQPPFVGRPARALLAAHATESPEPLSKRRPGAPAALSALVMRCLEKHPADRPQSAAEMIRELDAMARPSDTTTLRTAAGASGSTNRVSLLRVPTGRQLAYAVAVVIIGVGAYEVARHRKPAKGSPDRPVLSASGSGSTRAIETGKSIAVLPFANTSGDPENEHFSDGLTDELISALGRVEGLKVVARTSSFALKGKSLDVRTVGDTLGVGTVLEGSVRHAGSRLRISARLVNAADGYQLWSESYDREMRDVFAVQDEITRAIVGALRIRLPGRGSAPLVGVQTADPEAHSFYLKGRYFWNKRTKDALIAAIGLFRQATDRDPTYALAYVGQADAYVNLADFRFLPANDAIPRARAAVQRALELDSTLAEAHASLGGVLESQQDAHGAEDEYRRAIALKPSYATAHHWLAMVLAKKKGGNEEALREARRAQELDPLSPAINTDVGEILLETGRYPAAIDQFRKALELDPAFPWALNGIGLAYLASGRNNEALTSLRKALTLVPGDADVLANLATACAVSGSRDEAREILKRLTSPQTGEASPFHVAIVHAVLGDRDAALLWLDRVRWNSRPVLGGLDDPRLESLRSDPRFVRIAARAAAAR